jgi:hypothetical protein
LSIPRTISSAVKVPRAIHASGLTSHSNISASDSQSAFANMM